MILFVWNCFGAKRETVGQRFILQGLYLGNASKNVCGSFAAMRWGL